MRNKYIFIFSHSNQIDWYTVFADGFKECGNDYKTVIFVHGKEDAERARKFSCYDIVIDFTQESDTKKSVADLGNSVSKDITDLENRLGTSFFWEDIRVDRWARKANPDVVIQYMNTSVDILMTAYKKYQPIIALGEYTMAIYRYAYHLFASDQKVMLYPVSTRYYNRFYFETDLNWKWSNCIDNYYDYLKNGVPEKVLEEVGPIYQNIINEKSSKPIYTIHQDKFPVGFTELNKLPISELIQKLVKAFTRRQNSENINIRDTNLESNILQKVKRLIMDRVNHQRYKSYTVGEIPSGKKFATYFLHYQPEYTSDALGRFYQDQRRLISIIAAALPSDILLVVKEHPTMIGLRNSSYYRELLSSTNVILVNHKVDSLRLIRDGEIVFTIVGTPALEAMFIGKPAVMFGDYAFAQTNTISLCKDVTKLERLIREKLNESHDSYDIKKHSIALLAAKYSSSVPGQIPIAEELIPPFMKNTEELKIIKNSFRDELINRGLAK